jgi:hypothetical protein
MRTQINCFSDLKRWYSDQISGIDKQSYTMPFSELVEQGASTFESLLKQCSNFKYGACLDDLDFDVDLIFDAISDYEAD